MLQWICAKFGDNDPKYVEAYVCYTSVKLNLVCNCHYKMFSGTGV